MQDQYYIAPDATERQVALGNLASVYQEVSFLFEPKGRQPCGNLEEMIQVTRARLDRLRDEVRAARQRLLRTGFHVPDHWLTVETNTKFFFDPNPDPYEYDIFKKVREAENTRGYYQQPYRRTLTKLPYYEFAGLNVAALQQVTREIQVAELKVSAELSPAADQPAWLPRVMDEMRKRIAASDNGKKSTRSRLIRGGGYNKQRMYAALNALKATGEYDR